MLQLLILGGLLLAILAANVKSLPFNNFFMEVGVAAILLGCLLAALGGIIKMIDSARDGSFILKKGDENKRVTKKLENGDIEVWINK